MRDVFGAECGTATATAINDWIAEKTMGKITNVLNKDPDLAIVNTIYFKAQWEKPFDKFNTREGIFHGPLRDVTVSYMQKSETLCVLENSFITAVKIPFKGPFHALAVLPVTSQTTIPPISVLLEELNTQPMVRVELALPKFNVSDKHDFKEILQSLGVSKAFKLTSEFSPMIDSSGLPAEITEIIQQVVVEVDEVGATATAATLAQAVCFGCAMPQQPKRIVFDRPFHFYIIENSMGDCLFRGSILMASS